MQDFSGRTAVLTGGASGIGLGMARAFAARGMKLVLADLDDALLKAAEAEFSEAGISVVCQVCDVSKLEDVERLAGSDPGSFWRGSMWFVVMLGWACQRLHVILS